jgi:hypothetical protein
VSGKEPHYAVKFATRFGSATGEYLNAWTALIRSEELIEDARTLKDSLDKVMPEESRWHPWVGAEIVSYYAVGFVTCLEWHARSRLVDLLTFDPAAARSDDLKVVRDKVVLEMLEANVTIASIVGAATNISSFEEYIAVFTRILSISDSKLDGFKAIKTERPGTGKPWVEDREIDELKNLYLFRNELVHEIGIQRIGHVNVRDRWDPGQAIRTGELVRRVMLALEASVSATVPPGFPNVLDEDGFPASEWQRLEQELPLLEKEIERITTAFTDQDVGADDNWPVANAAAADWLMKEKLFLDKASMLHSRYIEMREPLKLALVKSRHTYLKSVIKTVGGVWLLDEPQDAVPPSGQTPAQ